MTRNTMLYVTLALLACFNAQAAHKKHHEHKAAPTTEEESDFAMGAHGGVNFSSATITNPTYYPGNRNGVVLGAFAEFELNSMFFIQPELNYVQRGAETSVTLSDTITTKYALNYMEIPVYLKVKYPDHKFKPYAMIGPNFGVLVSATYTQTRSNSSTVFESDIKGNFQNVNYAFDFGIGGEYPVSKELDAVVDARYSLGLNDVTTTKEDWKNTSFMVIGGVKYLF